MQRVVISVVAFALVGVGVVAQGAVGYTSQARSIQTQGGFVPPTSYTTTATDFGPFVAARTDFFSNGENEFMNRGQAAQNSTLGADYIRITGSVSGTDNYGSGGSGEGFGTSRFDVSFTLGQETPYAFFGTHTSGTRFAGGGISDWTIRLSRNGGPVLFERTVALLFQGAPDQNPGPFTRSGSLSAGTYRLQADFIEGYAGPGTGTVSGAFDLTLHLPTPGTTVAGLTCLAMGLRRRRSGG
ncbi:MAG: hypothetical protein ACKVZJ_03375 [Phycisphaerales bacterium]